MTLCRLIAFAPLLALAALLCACGDSPPAPSTGPGAAGPSPAPAAAAGVTEARYLLTADPGEALSVLEALKRPVGEQVTVAGRLQKKHKHLASFRLTDEKVEDCMRCGMPGGCKTPWDYCCHKDDMLKSSLTVELRGADGRPVEVGSWGIRELDQVVVRGTLTAGDGSRPVLLIRDGWFQRMRPQAPAGLRWPD